MNQKSLPRAPLPLALPFVVAAGAAPPLARSTPWPHEWKNVFSRNLPAFHSLICSICAQPRRSCGLRGPAFPGSRSRARAAPADPAFPGQLGRWRWHWQHQPGHTVMVSPVTSAWAPSTGQGDGHDAGHPISRACLLLAVLDGQTAPLWVVFISFCP